MNLKKCKLGLLVCAMVASILTPKSVAKADDTSGVLEYYTSFDTNEVTFYMYGVASAGNAEVMYGNVKETVSEVSTVGDSHSIYTIILVDNSQSVMSSQYGGPAFDLVDFILRNRSDGEKFIVAEIEQDINEVTYTAGSFSNDYEACRQILYGMECENKDADVYTNVSKAIDVLNNIQDSSYKRIIIISDGIHQNELTINSSYPEVKDRLKATNYPIYTVGFSKNNDEASKEDLRTLHELSRISHGEQFSLSEDFNNQNVVDRLKSDNELVRIVTVIENQPCDGSQKNARLTFGDVVYNCDVRLPVVEYVEETIEPTEETETIEETVETEEMTVVEQKSSLFNPLTIALLIAVIVVLIVVIILLVLLKKKGNVDESEKEYKKLDNQIKNERYVPEPEKKGMPAGATPMINKEPAMQKPAGNNKTQVLFQNTNNAPASGQPPMNQAPMSQPAIHRVSLQNAEDPSKVFSGSFQDKLTIGRNPGSVQIVIPDSAISGVHCEIGIMGNKFYIKDLKSSNGSFVNGTRCVDATEIRNGCQIKLGRTIFILKLE